MARVKAERRSAKSLPTAGLTEGDQRQFRFLRHSQIFASVVREILEAKFLGEVGPDSLTPSQFHLLKVIGLNGAHQVGELAGFLGVSPPAATKSIDKLERLGLIVRHPSKGDRRATLLSPSAKGRRLVKRYEGLRADRLAPVLREFGSEELDSFARLLERFSVSLLDLERPGRGFCLRCGAYIEEGCPVGRTHGGCPYQTAREGRAGHTGEVS